MALIDSNNKDYYARPSSDFKGTKLCKGDVGVAYLREGKYDPEYETDWVILGFEI